MQHTVITDPNGTTAEVIDRSENALRLILADGQTVQMDSSLVREEGDTLVAVRPFRELTEAHQTIIPLHAEVLHVDKAVVDKATVRIHKTVEERHEVVNLPLRSEEVEVERVPMDRIVVVSEPPPVRYEGETMVISLVEEMIVVERRLVVREEVRITKRENTFHHPQEFVLRSEHIDSERVEHATPPSDLIGN